MASGGVQSDEGNPAPRVSSPVTGHSLLTPLFTCELGVSSEGPALLMGLRRGLGFRRSKILLPINSRKPASCQKRFEVVDNYYFYNAKRILALRLRFPAPLETQDVGQGLSRIGAVETRGKGSFALSRSARPPRTGNRR